MRGRSQGISSSAFFVPTPNHQRLGFFSCSDSCMHYTKISLRCLWRISENLCCVSLHSKSDRLLLLLRRGSRSREHLQILAADERLSNRRTSQHDFLPQPLQYRGKKRSFRKTRQLADLQRNQAPAEVSLSYAKEVHNVDRHLDLEEGTPLDKASIDRSRSVLADTSSQQIRRSAAIVATSSGVCAVRTEQEPNNVQDSPIKTVFSYTSIDAPASSKPLQLPLQLSHLLLLRLVDQMCCNRLEHQNHRVNPRIRLVPAVHG